MGRQDFETETLLAVGGFPDSFEGHFDRQEYEQFGRMVPIALQAGCMRENPDSGPDGVGVREDGIAYTLEARNEVQAVAFRTSANCGAWETGERTDALTAHSLMAVRRLTPRECERLQDFPDDYTKISDTTADGPRYKALGNSWAVCCARWIVRRMKTVDGIREAEQVGQR